MTENFLKIFLIILGIFVIANLLFLDFVWIRQKTETPKNVSQTETGVTEATGFAPTPGPGETKTCQPACLEKIQEEVEELANQPGGSQTVVSPTPGVTKALAPKATSTPSPSVTYLTIGSSGSTSSTSWVDIAGTEFYFNLADYSKVKTVRWEINVRSFLGGNSVYARLYDVTNNRAVDNSEMSTTSSTSVILRSTDLTIWQGNNLYRVQAKSESGNPAYLDAPRLKITLE